MALFTLDTATGNPLKYEQLNSEETVANASALPTTASTDISSGAAHRSAEAELATTKLEVESSLLNAQSTYTEAERRLTESVRAQKENAEVIRNLTHEVFQGNRTVRDLLDARRDQLAASNAWAQAYASRALSSYDVERWQ